MPLKPERRKGSQIYRIRGTHHGIRVDQSAKTRSFEEAQRIAEAWEREIFNKHVLGHTTSETFAEMAIDYLAEGNDLGVKAEEILIALADKPIDKITGADVRKLALQLYPDHANSTRNRHVVTPISAALHWAAEEDRCPFRQFKRFKKDGDSVTEWRRPAEIEAILEAMTEPASRALMAIYVGCGLRASEAIFLDARELAPDLSRVRVLGNIRPEDHEARAKNYTGCKSGRDRSIPIPERAKHFLMSIAHTDEGRALRNSQGKAWSGRSALTKTLRRACERAGVKPIHIHGLRHTFATWHNAVHGDRARLMEIGGWSESKLLDRYVHAGDDSLPQEVIDSGWAISHEKKGLSTPVDNSPFGQNKGSRIRRVK